MPQLCAAAGFPGEFNDDRRWRPDLHRNCSCRLARHEFGVAPLRLVQPNVCDRAFLERSTRREFGHIGRLLFVALGNGILASVGYLSVLPGALASFG
ncbi:MAG TPA: hypothetical protein VGY49_08120 [Burkholderiaceae bacterium]|jgi:hypothetical protein|nr:hypothetical protein [Burkholderiaceae bacterium]